MRSSACCRAAFFLPWIKHILAGGGRALICTVVRRVDHRLQSCAVRLRKVLIERHAFILGLVRPEVRSCICSVLAMARLLTLLAAVFEGARQRRAVVHLSTREPGISMEAGRLCVHHEETAACFGR